MSLALKQMRAPRLSRDQSCWLGIHGWHSHLLMSCPTVSWVQSCSQGRCFPIFPPLLELLELQEKRFTSGSSYLAVPNPGKFPGFFHSQFTTILPRVGHHRLRTPILPFPASVLLEKEIHERDWLGSLILLTMSPADSQGLDELWACLSFPGHPMTCLGFETVKEDHLHQCVTKYCVPCLH